MLALGSAFLDVLANITRSYENKFRKNILCFAIVKKRINFSLAGSVVLWFALQNENWA